MAGAIGTSVMILFLLIGENHFANGEERDILLNKQHYEMEMREAKHKLYEAAIKVCPDNTTEVEKKLEEFEKCSSRINEDIYTMCQVVEKTLILCFPPLITYYEECVPKKAKGIPTYAKDTLGNLTRYICDESDGSHLLELANPCIKHTDHISSRRCIKQFQRDMINKYNHQNPPEKEEICLFIKDFQRCFDTHVDRFCKDKTTNETFKRLYNVFVCKK